MALEAVVFQRRQDPFCYGPWELFPLAGGEYWSHGGGYGGLEGSTKDEIEQTMGFTGGNRENNCSSPNSSMAPDYSKEQREPDSSSPEAYDGEGLGAGGNQSRPSDDQPPSATSSSRRKRRRAKRVKNKEELENQRMTHINVERNRRKQMNDYLSVLRSLMPSSYVQRGDQASIVGGAINFVKELEQLLQSLEAEKKTGNHFPANSSPSFADFFAFSGQMKNSAASAAEIRSDAAEVEVTMVESHANLKVRARRRPKQLLKMVARINFLRLTILHLNVTTVDFTALYSISLKVEEDCQLSSANEVAAAVYEMMETIQSEAARA